jgi:hypothetical protein
MIEIFGSNFKISTQGEKITRTSGEKMGENPKPVLGLKA